jgi:hypothetical protein
MDVSIIYSYAHSSVSLHKIIQLEMVITSYSRSNTRADNSVTPARIRTRLLACASSHRMHIAFSNVAGVCDLPLLISRAKKISTNTQLLRTKYLLYCLGVSPTCRIPFKCWLPCQPLVEIRARV